MVTPPAPDSALIPAVGATPAPAGSNADWTIPQDWESYSQEEHATWDRLVARQKEVLKDRAASAFHRGLESLRLSHAGIPNFERLSERLSALTGWRVVAVPGLVPDEIFFRHMAQRCFVAGRFIRRPDQLDYLQEPDVFHDVFGHVPLLSDPEFADYMQAYGMGGLKALGLGALKYLARLYWYTVEFGLIREDGALKIYGAGLLSSFGESQFALRDPSPNRIAFCLERVMRTNYRIDDYQKSYFVIESFEDLRRRTADCDFAPLYQRLADMATLEPQTVLPSDRLLPLSREQ
ncbi:MAG: phenylalanine 4-monooxygenase [Alphaproteobacteria bacterium]|nr:phenylalanine 4-monooxygenase [Alphaproteobacteria bacterium]